MSEARAKLPGLVDRPITFKNVEEVLQITIAALLDHEVALAAGLSQVERTAKRADVADGHIAELRRSGMSEETRMLRAQLTEERAEHAKNSTALQRLVESLTSRLASVEASLRELKEQAAKAPTTHVVSRVQTSSPPRSYPASQKQIDDETERAMASIELLKADRRELAGAQAQSASKQQPARPKGGLGEGLAVKPALAGSPAAHPSDGALSPAPARLAAGASSEPAAHASQASGAADAGPSLGRLLHEFELLRLGQAQNQGQLLTLQLQYSALAAGRQAPSAPRGRPEPSAEAAGEARQPQPQSAQLQLQLLVEAALPALQTQLQAHERMLHALAHTKADAAQVEAALRSEGQGQGLKWLALTTRDCRLCAFVPTDEKADARLLLTKADRTFCEALIARLGEQLGEQLGSVRQSASSLREELGLELQRSSLRAQTQLSEAQQQRNQTRVEQRSPGADGDTRPLLAGGTEDGFAVLWVSRLADPPNRPHGALKASPVFAAVRQPGLPEQRRPSSARALSAPRDTSPPPREAGALPPSDALSPHAKSAAQQPPPRPQSARSSSERVRAQLPSATSLAPTLFNDRVSGGYEDEGAQEYAHTGKLLGRKLRTDQVAAGHFNAGARQSPPSERVGPWPQSPQPQPARRLSSSGEVERLRERAREAREHALRERGESGRLQPPNGPPVQTERARVRLGTSASMAALGGPSLVLAGSDGRYYQFGDVPPPPTMPLAPAQLALALGGAS